MQGLVVLIRNLILDVVKPSLEHRMNGCGCPGAQNELVKNHPGRALDSVAWLTGATSTKSIHLITSSL